MLLIQSVFFLFTESVNEEFVLWQLLLQMTQGLRPHGGSTINGTLFLKWDLIYVAFTSSGKLSSALQLPVWWTKHVNESQKCANGYDNFFCWILPILRWLLLKSEQCLLSRKLKWILFPTESQCSISNGDEELRLMLQWYKILKLYCLLPISKCVL